MNEASVLPNSTFAVSGLVKFRASLSGLIEQHQKLLEDLLQKLGKVDDVLKMLDPGIELEGIKAKRPRAARQQIGATARIDALRTAENPLTTRELALKLVEARDLSVEDVSVVEKSVQQVSNTLQHLRKQGSVEAAKVGVGAQVWRLPT